MSKAKGFRSKTLAEVMDAVVAAKWRYREGGDHVVVYPPNGGRALILSRTSYDGSAMKQTKAQFRKAGLDV